MNVIQIGNVTVAMVDGEIHGLDEAAAAETERQLCQAASDATPPNLLLDLSKTEYFDSRFIETLVRISNRVKRRGGKFALCALTPFCKSVIHTSRLDTIWDVFETRDAALAKIDAP